MTRQDDLVFLRLSMAFMLCAVFGLGCGGPVLQSGSIAVSADSTSVAAGTTTQLHAMDMSAPNQKTDVTSTVLWSSSNPAVATVSATGLMTGKSMGAATISATLNNDRGSMNASIGAAAVTTLQVSPANSAVYTDGTLQYTATASYTDGTTGNATSSVQWAVSPANAATIGASGMLTAMAAGNYTVTATAGTQSAVAGGTISDAPLTSIAVTPDDPSVAGGTTQQFTATGTYANLSTGDLSKTATWSSSDSTRLTIDGNGLGTAYGNGTSETVTVTAQVGNMRATALARVTSGMSLTALVVLPTSSSIAVGSAESHTAVATYSDGTQQDVTADVNWSVATGTASVVTVDQSGTDTGVSPGMTTVQASLGGMQSQSVVLVTAGQPASLAIRASRDLLPAGSTQSLQLIGQFADGSSQDLSLTASWQSSDATVATVDAAGLVTALKAGSVQFSARFSGLAAVTTGFEVVPASLVSTVLSAPHLAGVQGESQQLRLVGAYSDGTTHDVTALATWQTSDAAVSSLEGKGLVYAVAPGTAQVTGTVAGRSASIHLTIVGSPLLSITILPGNLVVAQGAALNFTAIGHFTGGVTSDLTDAAVWTSLDPTVLTINAAGSAKSGTIGTTQVRASLLGVTGTSATVQVKVAPAASVRAGSDEVEMLRVP